MHSITIHSIFAYGKLKSLTNQLLNCVLNAFYFPPIRAAFSSKIRMPGMLEVNYEFLESLIRERMKQMRIEDLRIKLEYYSEDYNEEREMEPRPAQLEDALNKDAIGVERESEGRRPSKRRAEDNGNREVNLPPLLAAHLGRNKNGQPLQSTLTSAYEGHQPLTNLGGNLPPNDTHLSYNAPPFIPNSLQPSNSHVHTYVNPYPQPNAAMTIEGLKMPYHVGSNDGKGDPDNYLHLFEGSIVNYEDLKAKFWSYFSQQKKFTKTHLTVHNIKQRDGESTSAFVTRYADDTLHILVLHEEQRIFGFIHGLKTRSVEFLSTDLSTTYKGLMEKTYTWIKAKEVATNGGPNDHRESLTGLIKPKRNPSNKESSKSLRAASSNAKQKSCKVRTAYPSGERNNKGKARPLDTQLGEWKQGNKDIVPAEAPILMISRESHILKIKLVEEPVDGLGEITFPLFLVPTIPLILSS
nr:hypothetical protein [Tanacetum cinerariifolium]